MRIVVLRALGLGDLLTGIPALRGLRAAFADAHITLAAPAVLAPLAALSGAVDAVADTAPLRPLPPDLHGADLAVNLHGRGPQSTRLLLGTGPARLIAFRCPQLPGPEWLAEEHEVARWCRLLAESGIPADPDDLLLDRPEGNGGNVNPVVLHPGAASGARRWPAGRWAEVARALAVDRHQVVLTGNSAERPLASRVADMAGLPEAAVLAGRTGLAELAEVTAGAALVLSGDTGMAHLAAAFARPSVTLAGPVPPRLWGPPRRPWHRVLWAGEEGDPHAATPGAGLLALRPGEVIAAARDLLAVPRWPADGLATGTMGSGSPVRNSPAMQWSGNGARPASRQRKASPKKSKHGSFGIKRILSPGGVLALLLSPTRGGHMARDLRVHAHVVQRTRCHGGEDRAGVRAAVRRRAEIAALPRRYCPDDEPHQQDEPTDSHTYLRNAGGSCFSEQPRDQVAFPPTPRAALYAGYRRAGSLTASGARRCIVAADGPERTYAARRRAQLHGAGSRSTIAVGGA